MKKWIIFLSIVCSFLITVIILQSEYLHNLVEYIAKIKKFAFNDEFEKKLIDATIKEQLPTIIKSSISLFLLVILLASNIFLLISIAMRKITPLSISENLAAWKEHINEKKAIHKQRKLEKAQAKVKQLQNEIQKDDD